MEKAEADDRAAALKQWKARRESSGNLGSASNRSEDRDKDRDREKDRERDRDREKDRDRKSDKVGGCGVEHVHCLVEGQVEGQVRAYLHSIIWPEITRGSLCHSSSTPDLPYAKAGPGP